MIDFTKILSYNKFAIQCHDNPDADALACAYAFAEYLKTHGKDAEIVYGGFKPIVKSSLLMLLSELQINARYLSGADKSPDYLLDEDALLIVVDGQCDAGNVKKLVAANVAAIDHHVAEAPPPPLSDIRPSLGSCSTLVWVLLKNQGFNFDDFSKVSTALYYGLYSDTGGFTEITHPLDMDMRDNLRHDKALFKRLKNCNLSMEDLAIAGSSLIVPVVDKANQSAIFPARPCDPNVLGFISDLALQADSVETCVVFCEVSGGIKLSVRSCVKEIMAYELAQQLCLGCGSGGGHAGKAGGYISGDYIAKSGKTPLEFLSGRYQNYFKQYDLVYAGKYHPDLSEFERYEKLKIPVGFVRTTDIFPEGTGMIVRTLEGDTPVTSGQDIYIMVGIRQEIYPIKRAKFEASYKELDGEYRVIPQLLPENHYKPAVKNSLEGITEQIERFIRPCVSIGEVKILAKQIPKDTKVFTTWNPEGYMFGKAGDWLAIRADDPNDIYIIENTIFKIIYGRA